MTDIAARYTRITPGEHYSDIPLETLTGPLEVPHHYQRLTDENTHIRLLQAVNSGHEHPVWRLQEWPLQACPAYCAISYTWGNGPPTRKIYVNGGTCLVRQTCLCALIQCHLRRPRACFWIDSICINQDDLTEKLAQVRLMWDIYQRAQEVLACLGPHNDQSPLLVDFDWIPSWLRSLDSPLTLYQSTKSTWAVLLHDLPEYRGDKIWDVLRAYKKFARREYWNRAWIVQEIIAGRNGQRSVIIGEHTIPWWVIEVYEELYAHSLYNGHAPLDGDDKVYRPVMPLSRLLAHDHTWEGLTVQDIFLQFWGVKCSNPLDRIYGLYHLVGQELEPPLVPDYTISPFELAVKMTKHVEFHNLLDMMAAFELRHSDEQMRKAVARRRYNRLNITTNPNEQASSKHRSWFQIPAISRITQRKDGLWTAANVDKPYLMPQQTPEQDHVSNMFANRSDDHDMARPSHDRARRHPKTIYMDFLTGPQIVAQTCPEARLGDLLLPLRSRGWGSNGAGILLMLRPRAPGRCDIIGQACTVGGTTSGLMRTGFMLAEPTLPCLDPSLYTDELCVDVRLDLSPEDAVVLVAQDLKGPGGEYDWEAKLRRLDTAVTAWPEGAALIRPRGRYSKAPTDVQSSQNGMPIRLDRALSKAGGKRPVAQ